MRERKKKSLRKRKCWREEIDTERETKPRDLTTQVETKVTESTAD